MKKALFLALLVASASGCSTVMSTTSRTDGVKLDKEAVLKLKPGLTPRQSVITIFGNPAETVKANGEETLKYVYREKKINSYFGGTIQDELTGGTEMTTLDVVIKNDKVDSYKFKTVEQ